MSASIDTDDTKTAASIHPEAAPTETTARFHEELTAALKNATAAYKIPDPATKQVFDRAVADLPSNFFPQSDGSIYIRTGDINAEWLRDSSAQLDPLVSMAKKSPFLRSVIRGGIVEQWRDINTDPYANAFKENGQLWERKFELDSISSPEILAWKYWHSSGDKSIFTSSIKKGLDRVLATMETEQNHAASPYRFSKLPNNGAGAPVGYTGMIWSGFRPSDDACKYNYNIPQEMLAASALSDIADIERNVYHDPKKAARAAKLETEVRDGIQKYGVVNDSKYGKIYAYEVDGLGHTYTADDANMPSLLSAPLTSSPGASSENTRRFVLSAHNPEFFSGKYASGEGSQHTPHGYVWPLALVAQGLTATTSSERKSLIEELVSTTPDGRLHESFNPDNPAQFTRKNFSWPNAAFVELVEQTYPQ